MNRLSWICTHATSWAKMAVFKRDIILQKQVKSVLLGYCWGSCEDKNGTAVHKVQNTCMVKMWFANSTVFVFCALQVKSTVKQEFHGMRCLACLPFFIK